jgi:arylsulfatase A-like enzyme
LALLLVGASVWSCGADPVPHVLLVSLDTLRPDHLPCYGYERDTAPTLTRLAEQGAVMLHAYAPSPSTVPSHASLFTGLYPGRHRMFNFLNRLADDETTLAELLAAAGWRTVSVSSSVRFRAGSGFEQGFDDVVRFDRLPKNERSRAVTDAVLERLAGGDDRPSFVFAHYFGSHEPYAAPEPYRSRWHKGLDSPVPEATSRYLQLHRWPGQDVPPETLEYLRALYDGEIRYLDAEIARLLDGLEAAGRLDDTLVIVTSDHGEEFKEHGGLSHSAHLHEELLRVPLLVRWPAVVAAGQRLEHPVELTDVLPTVLELVGVAAPAGLDGTSFADALAGRGGPSLNDVVFGQRRDAHWTVTASVGGARYKLVVHEDGRRELFRLDGDPSGRVDVLERQADVARRLEEIARPLRAPGGADVLDTDVPEDVRERLREIGYVDEVR